MVYMSSSALDWRPILQGWLNTRPLSQSDVLLTLFESIFSDLLNFKLLSLIPKMEVLECNIIRQAIDLLDGLIPAEDSPKQADRVHIGKLFVFAIMWSVGALLELDDRKKVT